MYRSPFASLSALPPISSIPHRLEDWADLLGAIFAMASALNAVPVLQAWFQLQNSDFPISGSSKCFEEKDRALVILTTSNACSLRMLKMIRWAAPKETQRRGMRSLTIGLSNFPDKSWDKEFRPNPDMAYLNREVRRIQYYRTLLPRTACHKCVFIMRLQSNAACRFGRPVIHVDDNHDGAKIPLGVWASTQFSIITYLNREFWWSLPP
jgi:hypothetical protein